MFAPADFARAIQLRLRYSPQWNQQKTAETCPCGVLSTTPAASEVHSVGCAACHGIGPATRHNAVRDYMAAFLREHGSTVMVEPVCDTGRADLRVLRLGSNVDRTIDIVISNETCRTYSANRAKERKAKKYKDQDVTTAEACVLGGLRNSFLGVVRELCETSEDRKLLRATISKIIQAVNGKMLCVRHPRKLFEKVINEPCQDDSDCATSSETEALTASQPTPADRLTTTLTNQQTRTQSSVNVHITPPSPVHPLSNRHPLSNPSLTVIASSQASQQTIVSAAASLWSTAEVEELALAAAVGE